MRKSLILAGALIFGALPTLLSGAVIPVTDPNFLSALTQNNWVTQADAVNSTVCGASFTLGFSGTQNVTLQVDNAHLNGVTASRYPIIAWTVNGGPVQSHQLVAGETNVVLVAGVTNPIIDFYIKGMSPFEDRYNGNVPVNSVKITGFTVDTGGATFAVVLPEKIWLNIGDSIMSGDEAAYTAGQGRPADDNWAASDEARASYGYLLARHYGYREVRLAFGGYDWGGGLASVPALATLIDHKTSTVSRLNGGLLDPIPDVVLINLGENGAPALYDVTNALFRLRSRVVPATKIIVMIPVAGTAAAQVTAGFASYTNASTDTNAFLVNLGAFSFATGDGQHPTAAGHQTIFNQALPFLDPIIAPAPLRICPMGDSITAGYTDNPNWTVPFQFGYRSGLYTRLAASHVSFQFVGGSPEPWNGASGTVTNTPSPDLRAVGQDYHEGYTSQGLTFIRTNLMHWLTNDQPDVILLQAGINDIGLGSTTEPVAVEANLSNIVATVVNLSPHTRLLVAQITPYSSYTAGITRYNNYIANVLVPYFAGQGKWVGTANQYTNLCLPGTTNIDASLFANGINHPNNLAYDRMAQTWFSALQQYYFTATPLTVAGDPEPATAAAFVGEPITFTASFTSDEPLTYQWLVVQDGGTNIIAGATNATLTLTNLQVGDSGGYCLQASNHLGVALTAPGMLTVAPWPAPANNLVTAIAAETGRGLGTFVPGWQVETNHSLIAGLPPSRTTGNFSLEAPGRDVNALTAGGPAGLTKVLGLAGFTSSTNYVTCGNGGGAGSVITYTLPASPYGYNLTNLTVYGGWADNGRDQQAYTVYFATVVAPTNFQLLAQVNYNPASGGGVQSATRVTLAAGTNALAANVAAVKFDFTSPGSENGYCGYQQIALFGPAATQIESNSLPPTVVQTVRYGATASALDSATLATNLVRAGQPTLGSVTASHDPSLSTLFKTAGLNDGKAAVNANYAYYAVNDGSGGNLPVTITFNLNTNNATGGFPAGYVIQRIQALSGWTDSNLANQSFQLLFSLNGGPFISYGTFTAVTNTTAGNSGNNSILQTLTGSTGLIASGVTAVQFVFLNPGGTQGGSGGTLLRELQIFGVPLINLMTQPGGAANQFQLAWPQGLLATATNLNGPWIVDSNAVSPFTIAPTNPQTFYRVQL